MNTTTKEGKGVPDEEEQHEGTETKMQKMVRITGAGLLDYV
jgi:hypothetical protein